MRLDVWQRAGVVCSVIFLLFYLSYSFLENSERIKNFQSRAFDDRNSCLEIADRVYREEISRASPSARAQLEQLRANKINECREIVSIELNSEKYQELKVGIYKIIWWIFEACIIILCFWILIYIFIGVVRWVLRGRRT